MGFYGLGNLTRLPQTGTFLEIVFFFSGTLKTRSIPESGSAARNRILYRRHWVASREMARFIACGVLRGELKLLRDGCESLVSYFHVPNLWNHHKDP